MIQTHTGGSLFKFEMPCTHFHGWENWFKNGSCIAIFANYSKVSYKYQTEYKIPDSVVSVIFLQTKQQKTFQGTLGTQEIT